ncbi:MAG: hypothetical protein VSS75_022605 [Candidatus Parabeggiatoa sp.]|nr:hypothetical protein [Candidatus Parabeggiatoa sp.]
MEGGTKYLALGQKDRKTMTNQNKTLPTKSVQKIQKGAKDNSGNIVKRVLALGNEYVIYEIENEDINNQLRVYIDGHTDESENKLTYRFTQVKQNFIKAKGLLYRSANFGMMKNRIAHALASALYSDDIDGNGEFEKLIEEIDREYKQSTVNRILYIIPSILVVIVLFLLMWWKSDWYTNNKVYWELLCISFGSAIGGTLSVLSGIKQYNFEEHLNWYHYMSIGTERILLAIIAGGIAYIGIKAGILFNNMERNCWQLLAIVTVAGFSETFIPGFLSKISKQNKE